MGCLSKGTVLDKAAKEHSLYKSCNAGFCIWDKDLVELLDQMVLTCLVYETADGLPDKMFYLHPHNQQENSSHPLPSLDSTWCCQNSPLYHSHEQTSPFQ